MKRLALLCSTVGVLGTLCPAASIPEPLGLQQILAHMEERDRVRFASLPHYVCVRRYSLDNKRFHKSAEISVRMTYDYPGHKTFQVISENGLSVIRQRVLRKMLEAEEEASRDGVRETTYIWRRNYHFRLAGQDQIQGRPAYVLEIKPKVVSKFLIRGRIWLDCEDYAIVRLEASPAQKPSALIHNVQVVQQYEKVGPAWLPLYNHSMSESFWFGRTDVAIDSSDYRITQAN